MSDAATALLPILLILPVIDWAATVILLALAHRARPRIAFLSERAFGAVIVSLVTTVYALVALNTDNAFPLFDIDTGRLLARLAIVALGVAPLVWLALYWRRR